MVELALLVENVYMQAVVLFSLYFIVAFGLHMLFSRALLPIAKKTKTEVDDSFIKSIDKPLFTLLIIAGLNAGLKLTPFYDDYGAVFGKIFFVIYVIVVTHIISRVFAIFISQWLKVQKKYEKTPELISKIITVIVYFIAIIVVLDHFNVQITALVATLGLGGLAIGLALKETLSNFFAGIHLISDQPVRVGDYIHVGEEIKGYVQDVGWRSTRIKTLPNNTVILPNAKLAESVIVNNAQPEQEMSLRIPCGVGYGSNLKTVERVTVEVAKKIQKSVPGAVKDFQPFIRYHTFGDSNINFTVIMRVEMYVKKYIVKHEFIKALKERYDKEKIEISWPARKIYKGK